MISKLLFSSEYCEVICKCYCFTLGTGHAVYRYIIYCASSPVVVRGCAGSIHYRSNPVSMCYR